MWAESPDVLGHIDDDDVLQYFITQMHMYSMEQLRSKARYKDRDESDLCRENTKSFATFESIQPRRS